MIDYGEIALGKAIQKILSVKCNMRNKSRIDIKEDGYHTNRYSLEITIFFTEKNINSTFTYTSDDSVWNVYVTESDFESEWTNISRHSSLIIDYLNGYSLAPIDFYTGDNEITYPKNNLGKILRDIKVSYKNEIENKKKFLKHFLDK